MRHRSNSRGPMIILFGTPLLLALYVLSIGPSALLVRYPAGPAQAEMLGLGDWESAYAPLLWVTNRSRIASKCVGWYLNAWGVDDLAKLVLARSFFHPDVSQF